jgi:hypothetical protein
VSVRCRYAVYFVPEAGSALAEAGSRILGRDSESGNPLDQPLLPGIEPQRLFAVTSVARGYGLHATLKAPFFLKDALDEGAVLHTAAQFAAGRHALVLPRLCLSCIGSFLALTPAKESEVERERIQQVNALAAAALPFFDFLRAPPGPEETARRNPGKLSPRQRWLLGEWGYPYVLDEYRFHITLTDELCAEEERHAVRNALEEYLAEVLSRPVCLGGICVCKCSNPSGAGLPANRTDSGQAAAPAFKILGRFDF